MGCRICLPALGQAVLLCCFGVQCWEDKCFWTVQLGASSGVLQLTLCVCVSCCQDEC